MKVSFREMLSWMYNYLGTKNLNQYDGVSRFGIRQDLAMYQELDNITASVPTKILNSDMDDLNDQTKEIVNKVVERFADEYVLANICEAELDSKLMERVDTFLNILLNTYDKYTLMLSLYSSNRADLMKGLKVEITGSSSGTDIGSGSNSSTSKSRMNDTPQDKLVDGEWFDDNEHVSVAQNGETSGSSSSRVERRNNDSRTEYRDRDTIVAKLDEIDRLYNDMLLKWSNEFKRMFIGRVNYEA